jgi:hypothetical protein
LTQSSLLLAPPGATRTEAHAIIRATHAGPKAQSKKPAARKPKSTGK